MAIRDKPMLRCSNHRSCRMEAAMGHRSAIEADAVLLDEDLTLSYRQIDIPKLQGDDLLLAPIRVGICGSDLHVRSSGDWVEHWPAVLGHEVLARVVDSAAEAVPIGSKVIIDSRLPCLSCAGCKRSSRYCERLRWVGEARYGGLATRMSFPSNSVIRVPITKRLKAIFWHETAMHLAL